MMKCCQSTKNCQKITKAKVSAQDQKNFRKARPNSPKRKQRSKWKIPPQTPPFPFATSAFKPHALPEYLEGRTPKEKPPFLFQEKIHPRQIRNARSVFSFGVAGVLASAWGFLRAYDFSQSHHALRACDIICFGNRCELGTKQMMSH